MFKRHTDPLEYTHLIGIPAAAFIASYGSVANGNPEIQMGYRALGCLSAQPTARLGNALGMIGVDLPQLFAAFHSVGIAVCLACFATYHDHYSRFNFN